MFGFVGGGEGFEKPENRGGIAFYLFDGVAGKGPRHGEGAAETYADEDAIGTLVEGGCDGELQGFTVAFYLKGNGLIGGFLNEFGEVVPVGDGNMVKGFNDVVGLDAGGFGGGAGGDASEDAGNGFGDAGDEGVALFGVVGLECDGVNKRAAFDSEFTEKLIAAK